MTGVMAGLNAKHRPATPSAAQRIRNEGINGTFPPINSYEAAAPVTRMLCAAGLGREWGVVAAAPRPCVDLRLSSPAATDLPCDRAKLDRKPGTCPAANRDVLKGEALAGDLSGDLLDGLSGGLAGKPPPYKPERPRVSPSGSTMRFSCSFESS